MQNGNHHSNDNQPEQQQPKKDDQIVTSFNGYQPKEKIESLLQV